MDFKGKKVLITGGGRGIGKATALAFAAKGARIAINFRSDQAAALETKKQLDGKGHLLIQGDVSIEADTKRIINEAVDYFGTLDILVNNAGIYEHHDITKVDFDHWQNSWDRTLKTNLVGPANMCFYAAKHMMNNGTGKIVNVSSRGAFRGEPIMPAYGASKAGLNAMSQSLAQALAPHNIQVGVVAPGFVATDMAAPRLVGEAGDAIKNQSPYKRVAKPEEVAHAILFLASEGAVWSTGTIIDVNGASYLRS